jgi:hypothetical protein
MRAALKGIDLHYNNATKAKEYVATVFDADGDSSDDELRERVRSAQRAADDARDDRRDRDRPYRAPFSEGRRFSYGKKPDAPKRDRSPAR